MRDEEEYVNIKIQAYTFSAIYFTALTILLKVTESSRQQLEEQDEY